MGMRVDWATAGGRAFCGLGDSGSLLLLQSIFITLLLFSRLTDCCGIVNCLAFLVSRFTTTKGSASMLLVASKGSGRRLCCSLASTVARELAVVVRQ
jgi:hypothetical protein